MLFPIITLAQCPIYTKEDIKPFALKCSFAFASGICKGTVETISHSYGDFKNRFPNANDHFCNPDLSWVNKYKNNDPSQGYSNIWNKTIGVAYSDLYHLGQWGDTGLYTIGCLFPLKSGKIKFKEHPWKWIARYVGEGAVLWMCRDAGFTITHDLFFKIK